MAASLDSGSSVAGASPALEEVEASAPAVEAPGTSRVTLDDVLDEHTAPSAAPLPARKAQPLGAAMRTARVASISGRAARILVRGAEGPIEAEVAPEVDPEVIADAHARGDAVLVELCEGAAPLIVGALTTQRPKALHLKAATITIEGEQELLLRSGRGAVRIREDGDIEVVGSRISAASRGLFRIVGRLLRLN
ncbi:hypothetical protein SOCEGT47_028160 [Sorangium cellulosum]|uniref:Uncharacterized protein n=1 Tax=Sorangium cellulosum TaxID=56 RepID=A0A4P2PZI1_SORCE|nr:hypothetical protein [Sorangium cellulosum]AUX22315.1 hypothetical protein SOCEGT47_028160 [Sorangium cellulosum]